MKKLFLIPLILMTACGLDRADKTEDCEAIAYDITYTDGTHETVSLKDELKFDDKGDCISTCGCFSKEFKRCGVRTFNIAKSAPTVKEKQKDTLVIKVPTNLKK